MTFQGSEHSSCEVTFYRQRGEHAIRVTGARSTAVDGRGNRSNTPSLIAAQTTKSLGSAGTFAVQIKAPFGMSLFDVLSDDDWVDIVFLRNGKRWHTMRGSIDEVRCQRSVNANGATTTTWSVSGRDFQKVFDLTSVWFDNFTGDNANGAVGAQAIGNTSGYFASPSDAVNKMLNGFIGLNSATVKGNWTMPPALPKIGGLSFLKSFKLLASGGKYPERDSTNPHYLSPSGTAWDLATQWSDPTFCELYTDQLPSDQPLSYSAPYGINNGLPVSATQMAVVFRDRPFVNTSQGLSSPWFTLPMLSVPRTWIAQQDIGKAGFERYNAFFCSTTITTAFLASQMIDTSGALWNPHAFPFHGLRRFDIVSIYNYSTNIDDLEYQKRRVCNWHAPNPYWLNGSLGFGKGVPELKIGTRLRIAGATENQQETYYVEGVSHQWSLGAGMRTTANVTRGFVGSDNSLVAFVGKCSSPYTKQMAGSSS